MDISSVTETINSSINSLYSSFLNSINVDSYEILDEITFIDSKIIDNTYFISFLDNHSHSIIDIANALLLAFLIYYSFSYLFSHFSGTAVEKPFQFLIKFTICAICVNFSYFICEQIINIFDILTDCIREYYSFIFSSKISFSYLGDQLKDMYFTEIIPNPSFFSFDGLLSIFISFGLFNLIITYSYRYILIKLLILLSPFFILSFSTNSTKWLFKMWLKNFISLLSIQLIVSIILFITTSIEYNISNATTKVLYIGALYSIIKASSFVKDFTSGFTSDITAGISTIKNSFH